MSNRRLVVGMVQKNPIVVFCVLLVVVSWPVQILLGRSIALGFVGPSVCAFVVTAVAHGRRGVRELWCGVLRWRVPARYYFFALAGLGTCLIVPAYTVTALVFPDHLTAPSPSLLVSSAINLVLLFVFVGLGEEFGWRGFALPRVQQRLGPVSASLVVGLLWGAWHYPLIIVEQGGPSLTLVWFTIGVLAASVVYTWMFNSTGGSVLLVAVLHGGENTWTGVPFAVLFSFEPPGAGFFDALRQTTYVALAVAVALITRARLTRRRRTSTTTPRPPHDAAP